MSQLSASGIKTALYDADLRPLWVCLVVGLVLRLVLMPFTAHPADSATWAAVIESFYAGDGLYDSNQYWYTPVWGYVLSVLGFLMNLFGATPEYFVNPDAYYGVMEFPKGVVVSTSFAFIVKIPLVIADVLAACAGYLLVLRLTGDRKKAAWGFGLVFLCPIVLYSSAVINMFDTLALFFALAAVVALLDKRPVLVGVFMSLGVFTKVFPGLLIIPMLAYALSRDTPVADRLKGVGLAVMGFVVVTLLLYIHPILDGTVSDSFLFLTTRFSTRVIMLIPVAVVVGVIVFYVIFKKVDGEFVFPMSLAFMMAAFIALPVNHAAQYGVNLVIPVIVLWLYRRDLGIIVFLSTSVFVLHSVVELRDMLLWPSMVSFGWGVPVFVDYTDNFFSWLFGCGWVCGLFVVVVILVVLIRRLTAPTRTR